MVMDGAQGQVRGADGRLSLHAVMLAGAMLLTDRVRGKKIGPPVHPLWYLPLRLVKPMIMSNTKDEKKKKDDHPPTH